MSNSNILDTNGICPRWQFVNMFHDFAKSKYYCRLRLFVPGIKRSEIVELTEGGSTMQIAFDNANESAKHWKPATTRDMR